ncbi:MAG: glucosaminidase domain-containing protein [Chitinophagaceae bacterium]
MPRVKNSLLLLCMFPALVSRAQNKEAVINYITTYKDLAIAEMQRTGVPASITLAQGIHESGAGMSKLAQASNNHFGIKCKSNWTGESVRHDDDAKGECFRKYPSTIDSYKDHSDFLKTGQRYASLFTLDPTDYVAWANGLKNAGYATNPKYPQVLIKMIEDYNLQDYTMIALGKTTPAVMTAVATEPADEPVTPGVVQPAYPLGEFRINDTKVVFVKKGISYLSIAKEYDVDLSKIFEFNEIPRMEQTEKDQLIYLQRKRKTGSSEFHFVTPGETLHDIAQQEGIRVESLRELNWLKEEDKPAAGEKLSLKTRSATLPKLAVKDSYSLTPPAKIPGTN